MCQTATEGNTSLLLTDKLDNGKCDAVLPVKDRGRLGIFLRSLFLYKRAFRKIFHLDRKEVLLLHEVSHLGANALVFRKLFQVIEVRFLH